MATIRKRKDKYVVIYDYTDEHGKRKQKWETVDTKEEAKKRKSQIELDKSNNQFVNPVSQTVESFLMEWADIHGKANWQCHTYTINMGLIKNHIIPYIGATDMQKVTPRDIEKLYDTLRSKKNSRAKKQDTGSDPCLSPTTIRLVHIILKMAFSKAVEWKLIQESPVICKAPKRNRKSEKAVWDSGTVKEALDGINDPVLHLAVHLAFICSARNGEIMSLTWDCVDFDKKTILINKTLQRIYKDVMEKLPKDKLRFVFPPKMENNKTALVMKSPKTESSVRYVFFSEQLKVELLERKRQIERDKEYWGSEYQDFNLVLSLPDGYPVEPKLCEKWFKKWQKETNCAFPELVIHGLRHSSTTYKLVLSSGDVKAVQGDTGHASADMVVNTHSHVMDKARAGLMKSIEGDFYGEPPAAPLRDADGDVGIFLERIKKDPLLQQKVLLALGAQDE